MRNSYVEATKSMLEMHNNRSSKNESNAENIVESLMVDGLFSPEPKKAEKKLENQFKVRKSVH